MERGVRVHPSDHPGRAGSSCGRPWLPRGGATALRGGATELMGDVIVLLLSEGRTGDTDRGQAGKTAESQRRVGVRLSCCPAGHFDPQGSRSRTCSTAVHHQRAVLTHLDLKESQGGEEASHRQLKCLKM